MMSSPPPVTITSLFVWKIKHWASRLYSCKFPPPEDEEDEAMSEERRIRFREEDYIAFCFTENGEIRLMEDDTKPEASPHLWPHSDQGVEKWRKDGECAVGDHEVESTQSTDSNQSQATRDSFAFPVLRWDWVGSPIKMPNPYGRKHKFRAWILRLCTFPTPCKQNSLN